MNPYSRLIDSLVRRRDVASFGAAEASSLELQTHMMLSGRGYGTPHWGMKGNNDEGGACPVMAASPQGFIGAAQMGASHGAHVQDYPALPGANSPPALPTWIQDWEQLEGVVP